MPVRTRRWNDPAEPGDGFRLLVTRYRPRGVTKADETWDAWWPELGPSRALHAAVWGKHGEAIDWDEYAPKYLAEMAAQRETIRKLATRATRETITLLCSSACVDPARCHRSLLAKLLTDAAPVKRRPAR